MNERILNDLLQILLKDSLIFRSEESQAFFSFLFLFFDCPINNNSNKMYNSGEPLRHAFLL